METQPQQEQATIQLDDTVYAIDDLSDKAKYFLGQLQDIKQQAKAAEARLDQLAVAERGFIDLLRNEVKTEDSKEEA